MLTLIFIGQALMYSTKWLGPLKKTNRGLYEELSQ